MSSTQKYVLYMQVAGAWLQQLEDTTAEDRRIRTMDGWLALALDMWMAEQNYV